MRNLALIALLGVATGASADPIDDIVYQEMKAQKIPGLSIVVLRDGKPIKMRGYGFADLENKVKATPDSIYQSGSVGKQFASMLVCQLVQDGKLNLDDSISKWFPEGGEKWKAVTVRHLLTHTSGLSDMPYDKMDLRKPYTTAELLDLMVNQPAVEPPGTKWRYNNGGYVLLGLLIQRVSGKFYGDLMKERIFDPLGMKTARIISERDLVPNRARGYELEDDGPKHQTWVAPELNTTADGSLYLTVRDFAKWDAALDTEKLLKNPLRDEMWTSAKLNDGKLTGYGYGWGVRNSPNLQLAEHSGAWQGFTTYIGRVISSKLTVVVLTNLDAGYSNPGKIGHRILTSLEPKLISELKR